ncbi:hypothetical protein SAMN05428964_102408 [Thalassospira xiamenensis]|uniref:Uncharacterized protein n=1 Tax=Thalassospira xiamenensis TaxID=220697 RepID=A0A285T5Z2_9PROT|nr:hypothetical protein SAMN05428964_102408 [Thalassospira xiamenensis]
MQYLDKRRQFLTLGMMLLLQRDQIKEKRIKYQKILKLSIFRLKDQITS